MKKEGEEIRLAQGNRLRQIRGQYNMTQEQFAEWLGMQTGTYQAVESGKNNISTKVQEKLNARDISVDFVMYGRRGDLEVAWQELCRCNDLDKLQILWRLLDHFCRDGSQPAGDVDFAKLLKALERIEVQKR